MRLQQGLAIVLAVIVSIVIVLALTGIVFPDRDVICYPPRALKEVRNEDAKTPPHSILGLRVSCGALRLGRHGGRACLAHLHNGRIWWLLGGVACALTKSTYRIENA